MYQSHSGWYKAGTLSLSPAWFQQAHSVRYSMSVIEAQLTLRNTEIQSPGSIQKVNKPLQFRVVGRSNSN